MRIVLAVFLLLPALHAQSAAPSQIRSAASRAVAIVQRASAGFYKSQDCFSCHNHGLPMLAFRVARRRGIPVDEAAAAQVAAKGLRTIPDLSSIDGAVQDPLIIDPAVADGWVLVAADAAGVRPNLVTAAYARRIAAWQRSDGHWTTSDARPPQSYSPFTATAVAALAVRLYMPALAQKETGERLARARAWFEGSAPRDTEDHTFRLFGLLWTGAGDAERHRAAQGLLALQKAGGGWAELPHMQPDAYSTGEALVALHEAGGVPVTDPGWRQGLEYLLSTQDGGGSWHVRTRMVSPAPVSPPYLETGFPYGHDQFLSTDATCWAAMALMLALPETHVPLPPRPLPALVPHGIQPWMETALFGTASQLKAALDAGLDPNSRTPGGTTLAMMAAPDPAKLQLLIDRRADVAAKAKSGFTALMIAAAYPGASEAVKLLLAHGGEARPGTGVMFNASPLFMAAMAGDRESIRLLLAKGADPNRRMNLLGMFPASPLFEAVAFGDPAVVQALVAGGANVHEKDRDSMTAVDWAVIAHHTDVLKALLAGGADLNAVDRYGYTPLLYASSIDFGDAETAAALLRAGADPKIKDKEGRTALEHAKDVPYLKAALSGQGSGPRRAPSHAQGQSGNQ